MWQIRTVTVSSMKTVTVSWTGDLNSDSYCDIHWDYDWAGHAKLPNSPECESCCYILILDQWF